MATFDFPPDVNILTGRPYGRSVVRRPSMFSRTRPGWLIARTRWAWVGAAERRARRRGVLRLACWWARHRARIVAAFVAAGGALLLAAETQPWRAW